jgi:hypothetical protein
MPVRALRRGALRRLFERNGLQSVRPMLADLDWQCLFARQRGSTRAGAHALTDESTRAHAVAAAPSAECARYHE